MKTHWKKLFNPDYLGSYALDPDNDLIVTITGVKTEMVKNADGREEECVVLQLKDQKPMVLNATNGKTVTKVLESPYIEDWVGQSIQLYIARVKAFGEVVEAIRVRPMRPKIEKRKLNAEEFEKVFAAVKSGRLTKPDAIARYSFDAAQAAQINALK